MCAFFLAMFIGPGILGAGGQIRVRITGGGGSAGSPCQAVHAKQQSFSAPLHMNHAANSFEIYRFSSSLDILFPLKGQCHNIFDNFLAKQIQTRPHMNRQKRLRILFCFRKDTDVSSLHTADRDHSWRERKMGIGTANQSCVNNPAG